MRRPYMNVCHFWLAAIFMAGGLIWVETVQGEVFLLSSGGKVRGTWLNRDEPSSNVYIIRTASNGVLRLDRDRIKKILRPSPAELEYRQIRSTFPDTVEGHWTLAELCAREKLHQQRHVHLERIIQIDPDHEAARTALGFRRVDGKWMTREEEMAARGMVRYRGRYRTAQEIELLEQEERREQSEGKWFKDVKRWRAWLASDKPSNLERAEENLRSIRDPSAAKALTKHLHRETDRQVKKLLIEALAQLVEPRTNELTDDPQIASPKALKTLADHSLYDPDKEIRLTCLDYLADINHPDVVRQYIKVLKSKDNVKVNRAAIALRALKDPEAIAPLIDALVTVHKIKVASGNPGQTRGTFSPNGNGGISFGQNTPTHVKVPIKNPEVLSALVSLSRGANFEYRVKEWNAWLALQRRSQSIDARRD